MSENKTKILMADDDALLVELITHFLVKNGFQVQWAQNGKEALDMAESYKPAVIILDGMMPIIDGFEVLRILKENPATQNIPVMMLTARKMEKDILKGFSAGAEEYVVKPFLPEELIVRIKKILKKKN